MFMKNYILLQHIFRIFNILEQLLVVQRKQFFAIFSDSTDARAYYSTVGQFVANIEKGLKSRFLKM